MKRTRTWTRKLLLGSTIAVTSLALSACCKDNNEESTTEATPEPEVTAAAEDEPPELKTPDPEWKTKCPDAERPEIGTITVKRTLQIYKEPKSESDKLSSIGPGTWVNLLGAKGTWYCIDYPCDVGKLCPGWIEARWAKRKEAVVVDAGKTEKKKDAEVEVEDEKKDAEAEDEKKDAEAEKKDAGRKIRIPNLRLKDAGSSTPPGKRPPSPDGIKPPTR